MTTQASCVDCGFHHDPLRCHRREERKEELRHEIVNKKQELADLERYEAERASGALTFEVNPLGGSHRRNYAIKDERGI